MNPSQSIEKVPRADAYCRTRSYFHYFVLYPSRVKVIHQTDSNPENTQLFQIIKSYPSIPRNSVIILIITKSNSSLFKLIHPWWDASHINPYADSSLIPASQCASRRTLRCRLWILLLDFTISKPACSFVQLTDGDFSDIWREESFSRFWIRCGSSGSGSGLALDNTMKEAMYVSVTMPSRQRLTIIGIVVDAVAAAAISRKTMLWSCGCLVFFFCIWS